MTMKKILSLIVAVTMLLSVTAVAFAEEAEVKTLTGKEYGTDYTSLYEQFGKGITIEDVYEDESTGLCYIEVDGDGYITLNPPGLTIAQRIATRHRLLTRFLVALGVSEETASADACKMEHDLSDETFEKILQHAQRYGAGGEQSR